MKTTNELKKGTNIKLKGGWKATLRDNRKGNTRMAEVYGLYTEIGSIYTHNILGWYDKEGKLKKIKHTKKQIKCEELNNVLIG